MALSAVSGSPRTTTPPLSPRASHPAEALVAKTLSEVGPAEGSSLPSRAIPLLTALQPDYGILKSEITAICDSFKKEALTQEEARTRQSRLSSIALRLFNQADTLRNAEKLILLAYCHIAMALAPTVRNKDKLAKLALEDLDNAFTILVKSPNSAKWKILLLGEMILLCDEMLWDSDGTKLNRLHKWDEAVNSTRIELVREHTSKGEYERAIANFNGLFYLTTTQKPLTPRQKIDLLVALIELQKASSPGKIVWSKKGENLISDIFVSIGDLIDADTRSHLFNDFAHTLQLLIPVVDPNVDVIHRLESLKQRSLNEASRHQPAPRKSVSFTTITFVALGALAVLAALVYSKWRQRV